MDIPPKTAKTHEVFEIRRAFPRFVMDMPVTLDDEDGKSAVTRCHDLSPDGIQIRYTAGVAHKLFANPEAIRVPDTWY